MLDYKISGFSDEIDPKIDVQFAHLAKLGIEYFEPRGVDGKNIADISDEECSILAEKMAKYGIKASSIGSPIGKIGIDEDFRPHLAKLARVIEIAKRLGTKYIRVFSFYIPDGAPAEDFRGEVMERMAAMCALAEKNGVVLLHENEKGIYGDNAERCADILRTVNSPNLRAVFDPANFVQCGQPTYPEAFDMLAPYIEYMHIKDATEDGKVVPAGRGFGKVGEILAALGEKNYSGFLSLEPHLGDFDGFGALEKDAEIKSEKSDAKKFELAYSALKELLAGV